MKKYVAKIFGLPQPDPKKPLYSKSRNADVAKRMKLADVQGTDLFNIVQDINTASKRIFEE